MKKLEIKDEDRILIIAPHPDDESIGTDGLLSMYPKQCTVVIATDGGNASKSISHSQMSSTRRGELAAALELCGNSDYIELGYQDGELCNHPDCFSNIVFSDYSMVFLPNQHEMHPDHVSVFSYALKEIENQGLKNCVIYQYETRKSFESADYYLDITKEIEKKIGMISCYHSQLELFDHASLAKAINEYVAGKLGFGGCFFEAYTLYRERDEIVDESTQVAIQLARYRTENSIYKNWLKLKVEGKQLAKELIRRGWNSAGVYGLGKAGRLLVKDLKDSNYDVKYALDKRAGEIKCDEISVFSPDSIPEEVDVMIISTLNDNEAIAEKLHSLGYKNTISLAKLVYEEENSKK